MPKWQSRHQVSLNRLGANSDKALSLVVATLLTSEGRGPGSKVCKEVFRCWAGHYGKVQSLGLPCFCLWLHLPSPNACNIFAHYWSGLFQKGSNSVAQSCKLSHYFPGFYNAFWLQNAVSLPARSVLWHYLLKADHVYYGYQVNMRWFCYGSEKWVTKGIGCIRDSELKSSILSHKIFGSVLQFPVCKVQSPEMTFWYSLNAWLVSIASCNLFLCAAVCAMGVGFAYYTASWSLACFPAKYLLLYFNYSGM